MNVVINGEQRTIADKLTLATLLESFELAPQRVAIEVNEQLVRRAEFSNTPVNAGDRIEIVTLVGGG